MIEPAAEDIHRPAPAGLIAGKGAVVDGRHIRDAARGKVIHGNRATRIHIAGQTFAVVESEATDRALRIHDLERAGRGVRGDLHPHLTAAG